MPRNATGTYTLPSGNPVTTGAVIESEWANNTMADLAGEMTGSLSRTGDGGMEVPLKGVTGTAANPTYTFTNFPNSGIYAASGTDVRVSIAGVDRFRWLAGGSDPQMWSVADSAWYTIMAANKLGGDQETVVLADAQTVVPFTATVAGAAMYVNGTSGDRGRLLIGVGNDFTYDSVLNEVTLAVAYPVGTKLTAVYSVEVSLTALVAAAAASAVASAASAVESSDFADASEASSVASSGFADDSAASAVEAEAAAATAADNAAAELLSATSSTSLTIGVGVQTLTIETGKAFAIGQSVQIVDNLDPLVNSMSGIVTDVNSTTGLLEVTTDAFVGAGTYSDWTVSLYNIPVVEVDLTTIEANIALNAFNIAVNAGSSVNQMVDGVSDVFTDETGIDTVRSVNAAYSAGGDFYSPTVINYTPIYSAESFLLTGQTSAPNSLVFSADGLKFFMATHTPTAGVFEYTCSVAFDLSSTVVYTGNTIPPAAGTYTVCVRFSTDGTKMFMLDGTLDTIYEFTVSVAWDLGSTVTYTGNSFGVTTQQNSPTAFTFSPDGTTFLLCGSEQPWMVHEYSVSVGFDLGSTVAYTGNAFPILITDAYNPNDITATPDGTKVYVLSYASGDKVWEFDVAVGWDLSSTVTLTGNTFSVTAQETTPEVFQFSTDGTKFFTAGSGVDTLFEYSGGLPYSLVSENVTQDMTLDTQPFTALASPDSAFVVMHEEDVDAVTLNTDLTAWVSRTPFSVYTTNSGVDNKLHLTAHGFSDNDRVILSIPDGGTAFPSGFDGQTVYYVVNAEVDAFEISLTEGGAAVPVTGDTPVPPLNDASYSGETFSVVGQDTSPQAAVFNADGTKFFMVGNANNTVYEYTCSVGFDLGSTVAYSGNSHSVTAQSSTPTDVAFNIDGTKMFILSQNNDTVYEYSLSVGFDLGSTVAYSGNSLAVGAQDSTPSGITFNPDGTKLFMIGYTTDRVHEYTLSVGFDLSSSVVYTGNSFLVSAQETNPRAVDFTADGTRFFIVGNATDAVYEYTCSVGFDLSSTVAYTGNSFSVNGQSTTPYGLTFNPDSSKFFIIDTSNRGFFEYNLPLAEVQNVNDYGQVDLELAGDQLVGRLLTGEADLSTQAEGTAITTTIMTADNKALKIHALSTQWK